MDDDKTLSVNKAEVLSEGASRLMRLATYASVGVAAALIAIKLIAFLLTDSVSLLSTLIDSLLDAAASIINLVAVRTALVPPDAEHRFGHGKAEPLAAMGQSAFIAGSAMFLLVEAGNRLVNPSPIQNSGIGLVVMAVSIVATVGLVAFQRHVIRRTGSVAIKADALHYLSDLFVNSAVIVSLLLWRQFDWTFVDPLFAAGIGAYILWTAWQVAHGAFDLLMDLTAIDWAEGAAPRFTVVYHLLSTTRAGSYIRVATNCTGSEAEPTVPSVVSVWPDPMVWVTPATVTGREPPDRTVTLVVRGPTASVNTRPCHIRSCRTTPPSCPVRLGARSTPVGRFIWKRFI